MTKYKFILPTILTLAFGGLCTLTGFYYRTDILVTHHEEKIHELEDTIKKMDQRPAKIETKVGFIEKDVENIKEDVKEIKDGYKQLQQDNKDILKLLIQIKNGD